MQMLIGQVYNVESGTFDKKGAETGQSTWVRFRLGMAKPYKTEKVINGVKQQVRESTFITVKAFNGTADIINEYFSGEENKGRYIQVFGHFEEDVFSKKTEIDNPYDPNSVLEVQIPTNALSFIVNHFSFVGDAPEKKERQVKATPTTSVSVKPKAQAGATPAQPTATTPAQPAQPAVNTQIVPATEIRNELAPELEASPF